MTASAAFQSVPGPEIRAVGLFTDADIAPSLGRTLAGGRRLRGVDLIEPGSEYGERFNQLDLRLTKTWRLSGSQRLQLMLDVYNALNDDATLAVSNTFGPDWLRPRQILLGRFFKVGASFNF